MQLQNFWIKVIQRNGSWRIYPTRTEFGHFKGAGFPISIVKLASFSLR